MYYIYTLSYEIENDIMRSYSRKLKIKLVEYILFELAFKFTNVIIRYIKLSHNLFLFGVQVHYVIIFDEVDLRIIGTHQTFFLDNTYFFCECICRHLISLNSIYNPPILCCHFLSFIFHMYLEQKKSGQPALCRQRNSLARHFIRPKEAFPADKHE